MKTNVVKLMLTGVKKNKTIQDNKLSCQSGDNNYRRVTRRVVHEEE